MPQEPILEYSSGVPVEHERIGPFTNPFDANLAAMKLRDEGIGVEIEGENRGAVMASYIGVAVGMYLIVNRIDAERANKILADVSDKRSDREAAALPQCKRCGRKDVARRIGNERWIGMTLILSMAAWFFLPPPEAGIAGVSALVVGTLLLIVPTRPSWYCYDCGRRFRAKAPPEPELDDGDHDS